MEHLLYLLLSFLIMIVAKLFIDFIIVMITETNSYDKDFGTYYRPLLMELDKPKDFVDTSLEMVKYGDNTDKNILYLFLESFVQKANTYLLFEALILNEKTRITYKKNYFRVADIIGLKFKNLEFNRKDMFVPKGDVIGNIFYLIITLPLASFPIFAITDSSSSIFTYIIGMIIGLTVMCFFYKFHWGFGYKSFTLVYLMYFVKHKILRIKSESIIYNAPQIALIYNKIADIEGLIRIPKKIIDTFDTHADFYEEELINLITFVTLKVKLGKKDSEENFIQLLEDKYTLLLNNMVESYEILKNSTDNNALLNAQKEQLEEDYQVLQNMSKK